MEIDWVTVIAQILNFLVLVWLLNRVLYRPVTRALEARAEAVRSRLSEAEEARDRAEREAAALKAERAELESHRAEKLAAMNREVEEERHEMTEAARAEIAEERAEWARQLEREQSAFLERLRARGRETLTRLLAKALEDLADADLGERVAAVFVRRLEEAPAGTREELARAAETAERGPRIVSALPPAEATAARLREAVAAATGTDREIRFATDPGLGCGIVLEVGPRRLAWTIETYLDALEAEMRAAMKPGDDPPGEGAPAPRRKASEASC